MQSREGGDKSDSEGPDRRKSDCKKEGEDHHALKQSNVGRWGRLGDGFLAWGGGDSGGGGEARSGPVETIKLAGREIIIGSAKRPGLFLKGRKLRSGEKKKKLV